MSDALLIFARYPRLGAIKKRLSCLLDSQQRLDLYTAFLLDTLDRTALLNASRYVFFAGCELREATDFISSNGCDLRLRVRLQEGADLGQRMWNAFREVASDFLRTVVIGTDAPSLPVAYVNAAFESLTQLPAVIGPAEDGGYYLLGFREPRRSVFDEIDWGSGKVFAQTLERLDPAETFVLPAWYDVDRPMDLRRLQADLNEQMEGFPRRTYFCLKSLAVDEWPE